MASEPRIDSFALVADQASWVRQLAVALARDADAGEDIAQDALLAVARGDARVGSLRAWLAGTVRNLVRLRMRTDARRVKRELLAARPEHCADPTLALERLELQETLLGAVRGLSEPYRTAVLLRWFEALDPHEIARRTGAPVRTVHTRLYRALALLREELDRRSRGDRSRWRAAWLPALSKSSSVWKWVLLMNLKLKVALSGLVVAAAMLTVWMASRPSSDVDVPVEGQAALARAADVTTGAASESVNNVEPKGEIRTLVPAADASHSAPATAPRTLHGTVIDVYGARLAGIPVLFRGEPAAHTTSDARGGFEIEIAAERGELEVEAPGWISVYDTEVARPDPVEGYFLVLARPRTIPGFVRNRAGEPVAGARVTFGRVDGDPLDWFSRSSDSLRKQLGLALEPSSLRHWATSSSADGSFRLETVRIPGLRVHATQHTFRPAEANLPDDDQPVTLVLLPEDGPHDSGLPGRVVDRKGKPVHGACLRLGASSTRSDEHGNFLIHIDEHAQGARLVAIHPDWEPVIQPCLSASPTDPGAWPDPLLITFREPVTGIGGVIQDPEGKAVKDIVVHALDPQSWNEYLGRIGESAIDGGDRSDVVLGGEAVRTDEGGRFHIRGLAGRSYRLLARNKHTLETAISEPIPGGTEGVVIVIGAPSMRCRFAGVIVDLQGEPLPGASIAAMRTLPDGARIDTDWVRVDEHGRFEMPGISCDLEAFVVCTEVGPGEIVRLDPSLPRDAQLLQVGRIARVLVQIQTPRLGADTLVFLDASGTPLACGTKVGRGAWAGGGDSAGISGGKSDVLIVSERARILVLKSKGIEVLRVALQLDPARVNLVRP